MVEEQGPTSALGTWDRTQMGHHGFDRNSTRFYLFSPVGVRLVPLRTRDFDGILTGLYGIWLKTAWPPPRPTPYTHKLLGSGMGAACAVWGFPKGGFSEGGESQ